MATEELFRADSYLKECSATVVRADARGIVLDRTVFYPTGGGQPGDSGTLVLADGTSIAIADAIKGDGNDVVHVPAPGQSLPAPGTVVTAKIDWERRYKHMRMHSALHLLCAVVTGDVTGGQIGADKSRLDFNVPGEALDKDHINRELARLIGEDKPVAPRWIDDAELASRPELVRTMSVKPPSGQGRVRLLDIEGVDLQPCGGTHVARTSEIGAIEVAKIENKGRQNRRVNLRFAE
ncbi:MAG: Ala-tRNA(Pro) hydrolase [Alphaproteobacteria bacterium]|jgi:misacylated tRNA(Ala) deacylase|nr:Ala-tRNA(Pro) hydrolase [Alphaproteobacteria bacterium]